MSDPMDIENLAKAASEQLKEVLSQDIIVQQQGRIEELEKDVRKWQAKHDTWRAMALSAETNLEVAVRSLDEIAGKKTYADDPWVLPAPPSQN